MQSSRHFSPCIGETPELEVAVAGYLAGNSTVDQVMRAYYESSRVKRLIAHACYQSRVSSDFSEEITQELALLLVEKFLDKIEDADKIYNVLHRSACFMARRKADKAGEDSLDALIERSNDYDPTGSVLLTDSKSLEDQVAMDIDHRKAVDDFNRRLALSKENIMFATPTLRMDLSLSSAKPKVISVVGMETPPQQPKKAATKAATKTGQKLGRKSASKPEPKVAIKDVRKTNHQVKVVSAEGEELNRIRKSLGYTVPEFADVLNISKGTLSSYLYGIVQNVPEGTMLEARGLTTQGGSKFQALAEKFESMSMREIVESWLSELGLDNDVRAHVKVLSEVLHRDRATIWRWTERDMRPDMRSLQEYQDLVSKRAKAISRGTASPLRHVA